MSLVIVGMGPGDGRHLLPAALEAVAVADVIAGDERHTGPLRRRYPDKDFVSSDGGLDRLLDALEEVRLRRRVALLVSGDPCLYSLRAAADRRWGPGAYALVPGLSSFQLLCARAKLAWDGARMLSVHGRAADALAALDGSFPAAVFCDGRTGPREIAAVLLERGALPPGTRFVVGERLGYADERVVDTSLADAASMNFKTLCVAFLPATGDKRAAEHTHARKGEKENDMHISKTALGAVMAAGMVLGAGAMGARQLPAPDTAKKAILVVSFGTSYEETLDKTIGATERAIADAFPGHETRRAFSSSIIRKIWAKRGVAIDDMKAAMDRLVAEGYGEIIVQPLHLIPGEEYSEVLEAVRPYRASVPRLAVGEPLFAGTDSYTAVIDALAASLPATGKGEAVLFMGHGTHHAANSSYALVQMHFSDRGLPVYVGTVEGYPELDHILPRLSRDGVRKLVLLPLMLVAGDHANNDMAGDEDDSWKSILNAQGFEAVPVLRGIGELAPIRDIYVDRVRKAMASLDGKEE